MWGSDQIMNWGSGSIPADPSMQIGPSGGYNFSLPTQAPSQGGGMGFLNSTNANGGQVLGWGGQALGAAQGILSAYMGMKQFGLYKDQLAESKKQFGLNYDAQRQTTNASLEDRQRARVASNPGAYQSVGDYMGQNGIRGR